MPPKAPSAAATSGTKTKVSDKILTQFTSNLAILQDAGPENNDRVRGAKVCRYGHRAARDIDEWCEDDDRER